MKEQIQRVKGYDRIPMLLVGNKCDLEHQREVSFQDGMGLAQMWGCPFYEASAKTTAETGQGEFSLARTLQRAGGTFRNRIFTTIETLAGLIGHEHPVESKWVTKTIDHDGSCDVQSTSIGSNTETVEYLETLR